jgi:hypothetical protein
MVLAIEKADVSHPCFPHPVSLQPAIDPELLSAWSVGLGINQQPVLVEWCKELDSAEGRVAFGTLPVIALL